MAFVIQGDLEIGSLSASVKNLTLPLGLVIDEVRILSGVAKLKQKPFQVLLEAPAQIEAVISKESIKHMLKAEAPLGVNIIQVELEGGKIIIHASVRLIFEITAKATCILKIEDKKRLVVALEEIEPGVASSLVQTQLDSLNPVLDTKDLPLLVEFESIEIDQGQLKVLGNADAPR